MFITNSSYLSTLEGKSMSSDSITFEKRTESSTLKATSVEFRDDATVITAQGDVVNMVQSSLLSS